MNGERRIGEMLPARKRIRLDEVEVLTSVKMEDTIEHLADVCKSTSLALLNPALSKTDRLEIESIKSQAIQIYMRKTNKAYIGIVELAQELSDKMEERFKKIEKKIAEMENKMADMEDIIEKANMNNSKSKQHSKSKN